MPRVAHRPLSLVLVLLAVVSAVAFPWRALDLGPGAPNGGTDARGEGGVGVHAAPAPALPAPEAAIATDRETRTAWFRLDPPGMEPDPERRPVGVARWITGPLDAAESDEGRRVELELRWFGADVRLLVAERILPTEHRVIWREQRGGGGRTVLVSVDRADPTALVRVTETAAGAVRRRTMNRDRGAWQLLSLVEAASRDVQPHGGARVVMPQMATVEPTELQLETDSDGRRTLSLRFPDGLGGPSFTFEQRELVAFAWQAGGPVATRIPQDEHARWIRFGLGDEHSDD